MPMKATYEYLKAQDVYDIMNIIENHRIHHTDDDEEDKNLEHIYSVLCYIADNTDMKGKQVSLIGWKNVK